MKGWLKCWFGIDLVYSADQKEFLQKAVQVAQKVVASKADEEDPYWKNCWHWSLSWVPAGVVVLHKKEWSWHSEWRGSEAAYGHMVMSIKDGRVSAETFSQGMWYSYRKVYEV
jgi:hypothetical protein